MSDNFLKVLEKGKNMNFQELAKVLTELERSGVKAFKSKALRSPKHFSPRVGITGPPGSGKSTLVSSIISELKSEGLKIGVLAVDPSSPFTKGAILGDRIRYADHFDDPNVFIRSVGTRGSLGGLSGVSYLMLRAFDVAEFDLVLIETVGVGQTEVEVMNVADKVALVLVPESGDSIQAMKAGVIEIADLYIINKSDRDGAGIIKKEIESIISLDPSNKKKVALISALKKQGLDVVVDWIKEVMKRDSLDSRSSRERVQYEAKALLRLECEGYLDKLTSEIRTSEDLSKLARKKFFPKS